MTDKEKLSKYGEITFSDYGGVAFSIEVKIPSYKGKEFSLKAHGVPGESKESLIRKCLMWCQSREKRGDLNQLNPSSSL